MSEELEYYINKDLTNIFGGIDISSLSNYQKRQMIFDYLSNTLTYDWNLYFKIFLREISKANNEYINRNFKLELAYLIKHHKGVCISIASYYKLLLKRVNISSLIIGTSDGTPVNHVLNLVYNDETDTYSFDDITSMLTRIRSKKYCFDYDLIDARKIRQGRKNILTKHNEKWVIIPSINYEDNTDRKQFYQIEEKILSLKKKN